MNMYMMILKDENLRSEVHQKIPYIKETICLTLIEIVLLLIQKKQIT